MEDQQIDISDQFKSGIEIIIAAFESQKNQLGNELEVVSAKLEEKDSKIKELENLISKLMNEKRQYESKIQELEDQNQKLINANNSTNTNSNTSNNSSHKPNYLSASVLGKKSKIKEKELYPYDNSFLENKFDQEYFLSKTIKNSRNNSKDYLFQVDHDYTNININDEIKSQKSENINDNINCYIPAKFRESQTIQPNNPVKKNRPHSMKHSYTTGEENPKEVFNSSTIRSKKSSTGFFKKCKTSMNSYYYEKIIQVIKSFNNKNINKKDTYNEMIRILREANCLELLDDLNQLFM